MRRFERQREREGWVEWLTQTALAWIACLIFGVLIAAFVAGLFLFAAKPSLAADIQYPVSVPGECVELAQREGQPILIENKTQGIKAKAKLRLLSGRDPLVKQCRDAVKAMEQK